MYPILRLNCLLPLQRLLRGNLCQKENREWFNLHNMIYNKIMTFFAPYLQVWCFLRYNSNKNKSNICFWCKKQRILR